VDASRLESGLFGDLDNLGEAAGLVARTPVRTSWYRSIWISDLHLGTPVCQAAPLLDFLRRHRSDNLYLVGDIVDGWNHGRSWHWSPEQGLVAEELKAWRRRGSRVVFLPGNHDQSSIDLFQGLLGAIPIQERLVHRTAEGRRMLVLHGHQFDGSLSASKWPARMGGRAYLMALRLSQRFGHARAAEEGALGAYIRSPVRRAIHYLTSVESPGFDRAVVETARRHHADGVICGHVHRAEQRLIGSIWYVNDGDWVESCTALAEDRDGALHILLWGLKQTIEANAAHAAPALEARP
jgi:UDP-2,3-diacylglucosamine pyrophosphatase LpxH